MADLWTVQHSKRRSTSSTVLKFMCYALWRIQALAAGALPVPRPGRQGRHAKQAHLPQHLALHVLRKALYGLHGACARALRRLNRRAGPSLAPQAADCSRAARCGRSTGWGRPLALGQACKHLAGSYECANN